LKSVEVIERKGFENCGFGEKSARVRNCMKAKELGDEVAPQIGEELGSIWEERVCGTEAVR